MDARRHTRAVGLALPVAAAAGAIAGALVFLAGNDNVSSAGIGGLVYWVAIGSVIGAATGLCALIGGYWRVAVGAGTPSSTSNRRIRDGRVGAALGVGVGWATLTIAIGLITGLWFFSLISFAIGVGCVALAALIAGTLIAGDERRDSSRPTA